MATIVSNEVNATPVAPPTVTLNAVPGNNRVDLSWNQLANATATRVYRKIGAGGVYSLLTTLAGNVLRYADIQDQSGYPANGTLYVYKVEVDVP
jgi:hypothetical protein